MPGRANSLQAAIPLGTMGVALNVVMVARGRTSETLEVVRSLLANTISSANILLWDDSSNDNTADALKEIEGFDGRVVCCDSPRRRGLEFAAKALFDLFPGPPMVALVRQDAEMPYGWDARLLWIYRMLWPHGAVLAAWKHSPKGNDWGRRKVLADTAGKPEVVLENAIGVGGTFRGHRVTREESPAIVVSSEVFRKHSIPEDLSRAFEALGRPVATVPSVQARMTGKGILVAAAGA